MNINLDMVLVIQSILCGHAHLKLKLMNISFLSLSAKKKKVFILLYGSQRNNSKSLNQDILKNLMSYLKASTRCDRPLFKL